MKNILGIIGGMGPMASDLLYKIITDKTKVNKDQDHLDIILLSHASMPDRTEYILNNNADNPFPLLLEDCKTLKNMGVKMISIACNTSCFFHKNLQKEIDIPISNIIENTVKYIKNKNISNVCILATDGTIKSRLYQNKLDKYNITYEVANSKLIMSIIYDYIKQGKEVPIDTWKKVLDNISAKTFILGCTELSLLKEKLHLDENFIDPLTIEAENILKFFGKEVK